MVPQISAEAKGRLEQPRLLGLERGVIPVQELATVVALTAHLVVLVSRGEHLLRHVHRLPTLGALVPSSKRHNG